MKIYDITVPLSAELPAFPGDPQVTIEPLTTLAGGAPFNVSRIAMTTHSGTHLDAPRHCDDRGMAVDDLPFSLLMGDALVAEIEGVKTIGRNELARLPLGGEERLLLKTGNSHLWKLKGFSADFVHLAADGARYLLEMGIRLLGIDYLSVERADGDGEVHRLLLGNGVVILEGLNLKEVPAGSYELICLPMKIVKGDGAPARALLRARERPELDLHTTRWPLA
ncbi:MAG TPA: cyclase family protein [Desulfuromonadaceae bacterium]